MADYTPYELWDKPKLEFELYKQVQYFGLPFELTHLIREIIYSPDWNPLTEFDGCSVIQDPLHPFLPCFVHDWMWVTGRGGSTSDKLFRRLLLKTKTTKNKVLHIIKSNLMWLAVRFGWLAYYKWSNLMRGNKASIPTSVHSIIKSL